MPTNNPKGRCSLSEHLQHLEGTLGPGGRLGVSAALLDPTGAVAARIDYRSGESFPMASVVKIPIAMAVTLLSDRGQLSFRDQLIASSDSASPGPASNPLDRLFFLPWNSKRSKSIDELFDLMLIDSDNTAADAILARVGGPKVVQAHLEALGIEGIHFTRSLSDLLTHFYDLRLATPGAGSLQRSASIIRNLCALHPPFTGHPTRELGLVESGTDTATPAAMTRLLQLAFSGSRFGLLQKTMRACRNGPRRMPRGLQATRIPIASLAHKTGSLGGITNDVGVVALASRFKVAVSVLSYGSSVPLRLREEAIAECIKVIMESLRPIFAPERSLPPPVATTS